MLTSSLRTSEDADNNCRPWISLWNFVLKVEVEVEVEKIWILSRSDLHCLEIAILSVTSASRRFIFFNALVDSQEIIFISRRSWDIVIPCCEKDVAMVRIALEILSMRDRSTSIIAFKISKTFINL